MNSYQDENNIMTDQQIIHNNAGYIQQPNSYVTPLTMQPPSAEQQIMMNQGNFDIPPHHLQPPPPQMGIKQEAYEDKNHHPTMMMNNNNIHHPQQMENTNNYMEPNPQDNDELNESLEEEDETEEVNGRTDSEDAMNQQNNMMMNGYNNGPNNFHNNPNMMNDYNNPMMHQPQQPSMFEPIVETVEYSYPIQTQPLQDLQSPMHNYQQPLQHEPVRHNIVNLPPQPLPMMEDSNSPGRLRIDMDSQPGYNDNGNDGYSAEEASEIDDDEAGEGDLDRNLKKFASVEINNANSGSIDDANNVPMGDWGSKIDRDTRTCPICCNNKMMSSMNNVLRHIKEVHGKDNPTLCEQVAQIRQRLARKYTPRPNDKPAEIDDNSADMLKSMYNPITRQCNGCGQTLVPDADWKQHLLDVHKMKPASSNQESYPPNENASLQPIPITPLSLSNKQNVNNLSGMSTNPGTQMNQQPFHTQSTGSSKAEKKPFCHLCNSNIRFDNFTRHLRQKHGCGEDEINKIYADLQMKRIKRKDSPVVGSFDGHQMNERSRRMQSPYQGNERDGGSLNNSSFSQPGLRQNLGNNGFDNQGIANFAQNQNMSGNGVGNSFHDGNDSDRNNMSINNSMGFNQHGQNNEMVENLNWEQDLIKTIRDRKFECPLCLRQLTERRNLINHVKNVHKKDCSSIERTLGPRLQARSTTSGIRKDDGKFAERVLGPRYKQMDQALDHNQRPLEPIRINNQPVGPVMDSEYSDGDDNERMMGKNHFSGPSSHKRGQKNMTDDHNPVNNFTNPVAKKITKLSQNQDPRFGVVQKVFVCPICNTKFRRDPRKIVDHLFDRHGMQPVELIQRNLKIGIRQCRRRTAQ